MFTSVIQELATMGAKARTPKVGGNSRMSRSQQRRLGKRVRSTEGLSLGGTLEYRLCLLPPRGTQELWWLRGGSER